jgi:hypothetical protein
MRRKIDFIYIDSGGGHRAAATALAEVIGQQQRPWDLQFHCLQDLLDSIDFVRKSVGIPFQDVYNLMLRHGWTFGTAQMLPLMHLLIRLFHRAQVQVLTRHWASHRPDMVVSLIPHYNRALREALDQAWPGTPFRDHPDRHRRLSAELLDRAGGAVPGLRIGARGGPGARHGCSGIAHRAHFGHDSAPAFLRASAG